MIPTKQLIVKEIQKALKDLTNQDIVPILEHPKDEKHGDYSSNVAMALFQKSEIRNPKSETNFWRSQISLRETKSEIPKYKTPLDLGQEIVNRLEVRSKKLGVIEKVEAVAPGFINFWLSKDYLASEMIDIVKSKDEYGKSKLLENQKIMVEFTDPNPFKEFHIGHLYSNIVGESLSRLLESQGAIVWRVCYQGDVGLHVAKALYGILHNLELRTKNLELEEKSLGDKIKILGEAYALGVKKYEEDEGAKNEIEKINKEVYEGNPSIMDIYKKGREWSLEYFDKIYKRLGTKFKRLYFESEAAKVGARIVKEHIDDVFKKSEGAVIFNGEKYGLHNRVFLNAQGLPTYEAKELGLAPIKYKDFKYDQSIIVTGNEIIEYFKVLLKALGQIYPNLAKKTKHIGHGMVRLPGGKLSSRLGNILLTGEWLLDEAKRRIQKTYKEMDQETAEKVAVGAVKYSLLKSGIGKDLSFDFDESISLEGNSGPYLQYTFARTQSVVRKSEIRNPKSEINSLAKPDPASQENNQNSKFKKRLLSFEHSNFDIVSNFDIRASNLQLQPEEVLLLRTTYRFPEVVGEAAEKFSPNILCNYLFDLSQKFNLFYQKLPILNPGVNVIHPRGVIETQGFRLALTAAVGHIIKNGLYLLGISAPERM